MSRPRFHVPEAAPGARVVLPEHTSHHAREVLRLRPGADVCIFDGHGTEFTATLDEVSRRAFQLVADGRTSLWKAVVYSLVQLQAAPGRRARR